jgi:transcriptional regulator with XRE-family HTH domain
MRRIRTECGITLNEMERLTGISHQYYSEIELSGLRKSGNALALVQKAFEAVIADRRASSERLCLIYNENKDRLLESDTPESQEHEGEMP